MAAWMRTAIVIVALSIAAVVGTIGASWLDSQRGGFGPTIHLSNTPILAALAVLLVIAVATALGTVVAKATTSASGMFIVGFALFVLAMRLQGVSEFVFSQGSVGSLVLESVGLSILVLAASMLIFQVGGHLRDVPFNKHGSFDATFSLEGIGRAILVSLAILPVVWIIAVAPSKGQAIGAAFAGGIAVGSCSRYFAPSLQPVVVYAAPTAVASIGYVIAHMFGVGVSDVAFTQQTISPLLTPMPIDYAAGSIMGISIGLSWVVSADKVRLECKVTKELD